MKSRLIGVAAVWLVAVSVLHADIPAGMDYHVYRTNPQDPFTWQEETNKYGWTMPSWVGNNDQLLVPNEAIPDWTKHLYLELEYTSLETLPPTNGIPAISLADPTGAGVKLVSTTRNTENWSITWHWTIYPQPASETIQFPGLYGYDMAGGEIFRMDVATYCIPEPGALALVAVGLVGLVLWRRK